MDVPKMTQLEALGKEATPGEWITSAMMCSYCVQTGIESNGHFIRFDPAVREHFVPMLSLVQGVKEAGKWGKGNKKMGQTNGTN